MFGFAKKCTHDKITPERQSGYCPDCGEYVENLWYITRCQCCGVKQRTRVIKGKVESDEKFCRNCGSSSFLIEELNKIDVVNINYAVVIKKTKERRKGFIQSWVEESAAGSIKLLPAY